MVPVNSKSLLCFVFDQMEKLDKKEISTQEGQVQANLAKQANNLLSYELKRAQTLLQIKGTGIELREIESKAYDNTI